MSDQHHHSFYKFLDEMALKFPGRDVEGYVLQVIVEADRHPGFGGFKTEHTGVKLHDAHMHDAINYTLSGDIEFEGVEYGFIVRDGNWDGTSVLEWGLSDDVGRYEAPPPTIYTMIPTNRGIHRQGYGGYAMFRHVYLAWREEKWFQDLVADYNYDRTFSPTLKIENHYRDAAAKRALSWAHPDEFERMKKEYDELHAIVGPMTEADRKAYFDQQDAVFATVVRFMGQ